MRKAKVEMMYREYIRVSGLNNEELMTEEEKVERKRSFMAGIWFFAKWINENINRLKSSQAGDMLRDVDSQLKRYWKSEYERDDQFNGREAKEGEDF